MTPFHCQRHPHYPPIERPAILELRAARGWSLSETARRLLLTCAAVASGMGCWRLALVVDHYSRRVMKVTVFEQAPTSGAVGRCGSIAVIERLMRTIK